MILDCVGIIATLVVRLFFKEEKEKTLLKKISSLYVFTDGKQQRTTSCGISALSNAEIAAKVMSYPVDSSSSKINN